MSKLIDELEFETAPGGHVGWTRYHFELYGRRWLLLTIDNDREPPHSMVSATDRERTLPWPNYKIVTVDGVITPRAAAAMIEQTHLAWEHGITEGRRRKAVEVRQVLETN